MNKVATAIILYTLYFLLSASLASAATLYLDPSDGTYARGDAFSVTVRIDPQDECINTADIYIKYPNSIIKGLEIGRGSSIFSLWVDDPDINEEEGIIHIIGGIPGGYCGRLKGDPGLSNVIAELIFQVPSFTVGGDESADSGEILFMDGTEVLLNDGFGTPAKLTVFDSKFNIGGSRSGRDEWFEVLREDVVPPEPFSINLVQNHSVFDGKFYIVFSTLDKQSGIDHYEIYEEDLEREGFKRDGGEKAVWIQGKSPYVLEDQSLNSIIRVYAIDKAGNRKIAALKPPESLRTRGISVATTTSATYIVVGIALLLFIIIFFVFLRRQAIAKKHATIISNDAEDRQ